MTRLNACMLFVCVASAVTSHAASARPLGHRHHHQHRHVVEAPDPTPDCRYPDGTPYDPDIIGGQNHVGYGGPAVNLGGDAPCGY